MNIAIAPLAAEHLPACATIATHAPDVWKRQNLEKAKDDLNHWNYVALEDGEPIGFVCFLALFDCADLEMLVVQPQMRRRGVARALLQAAFSELAAQGIARCLLEVRCQNQPAVELYTGLGFKTLARRPGLFQNPPDDGFLMAKRLL